MRKLIGSTLLVTGLVSSLALGACSGSAGSSESASGDKQVITAMYIGGTADKGIISTVQTAVDKFNSDNDYNVEVQFETYENEQYKTKLASLMASNAVPDVFFTWGSGYLEPFVKGGKVLDLTPYLDQDSAWKDRFLEGVFSPVTFDNKIYGIPHGQAVAVMFYNTRIFEELGLEKPNTYDEFLDVVKKLKAANVTPISAPVKDAWIAGQLMQQLANVEGNMELFNGTVEGTVKWNDPRYVAAGARLKELQELGAFPDGYLGMTNDEGRNLFTSGEAAMYYMGSWDINAVTDSSSPEAENIGAFNIPQIDPKGENTAVGDVDETYAVSANTKNAEAAVAFLKTFSEPEIQQLYAYDASNLISTNADLDDSKVKPLFKEISNLLRDEITGITPWFDRVFGVGEGVEFNNVAQAVIAGNDPQQKLDELQQFAEDNANR